MHFLIYITNKFFFKNINILCNSNFYRTIFIIKFKKNEVDRPQLKFYLFFKKIMIFIIVSVKYFQLIKKKCLYNNTSILQFAPKEKCSNDTYGYN